MLVHKGIFKKKLDKETTARDLAPPDAILEPPTHNQNLVVKLLIAYRLAHSTDSVSEVPTHVHSNPCDAYDWLPCPIDPCAIDTRRCTSIIPRTGVAGTIGFCVQLAPARPISTWVVAVHGVCNLTRTNHTHMSIVHVTPVYQTQ